MTSILISVSQAELFIKKNFVAVGVPEVDAELVAKLMIQSDLAGADGHGIFRLPSYIKRIKAGGINLHPKIRFDREHGATGLLNGDNAWGI